MKLNLVEYGMESAELGLFMFSACTFAILLNHPSSPLNHSLTHPVLQRALMGLAMALTAASIIYSPFGKRSGAHFNPSVTLTFWRLGKVRKLDAICYVIAQFIGAVAGVYLARLLYRDLVSHPAINFVTTRPGPAGWISAFFAETLISALLMFTVLTTSRLQHLERYTGLFASSLVALFITFESPISGMSMNPARSFGSAFASGDWTYLYIYFTAPAIGMLTAAEIFIRTNGRHSAPCAKLRHSAAYDCIFCGSRK